MSTLIGVLIGKATDYPELFIMDSVLGVIAAFIIAASTDHEAAISLDAYVHLKFGSECFLYSCHAYSKARLNALQWPMY